MNELMFPPELFVAYPMLEGHELERLSAGLINETYRVGPWVVQRLHPIFRAEVNDDIAALVPLLRRAKVPVPSLLRCADGRSCCVLGSVERAQVWRVLEWLPGRTVQRVESERQLASAAAMLARFHGALCGVEHAFAFARLGIHDTEAHLGRLRAALEAHSEHRLFAEVERLGAAILSAWSCAPPVAPLPNRIGHGDPKISNFLFDASDEACAILDLDTMGTTTLDAELGDALRSWCNRADESAPSPVFDRDRFLRARDAYAAVAKSWLEAAEYDAMAFGCWRISLELASRFATDALEERYFGWDPSRAASRGEHNLLRARNQWSLAIQCADALGVGAP